MLTILLAGTGVGDNVTIVVSDKGKRKVTECAYYISNVGKSTSGKDIDYYVEEAHRVFLDIPTGTIPITICYLYISNIILENHC